MTRQPVGILAAGRTDTGVHATGQVIAFDVDWKHADQALLRAINANLPPDIALQDIRQQPGFHPRYDAHSRIYRYTVLQTAVRQPLLRERAWQVHNPLDPALMQAAAEKLVGTHDFAAFGQPPQGDNTVRQVFRSEWQVLPGGQYVYEIEATAFLYHMVRRIVGTLVDVGRGWLSLAAFDTIFRSADLTRTKTMAPPQGLVLVQVRYEGGTPAGEN